MLAVLSSSLKCIHIIVIIMVSVQVCSISSRIGFDLLGLELGLTMLIFMLHIKRFEFMQIVLSLSLSYTLIPNNYRIISGVYLLKMIYVYEAFGEISSTMLSGFHNLIRIVLGMVRYTVVEYLFLGLVIFGYKMFTKNDTEGTVPEDYILLYKMIVTATTIGYGDITPKTRLQIYFFTYAIPFMCGSFVLYFNAMIPLLNQFVEVLIGSSTGQSAAYSLKSWTSEEADSFGDFATEVATRQLQDEEMNKRFAFNWIAISAFNYEKQIPLLTEILSGKEGKQIKLAIASKIRKLYYPKGWIIINEGDVCEDLLMVEEGVIESTELMTKGAVFNKSGFVSKKPSAAKVMAKTFVVIWGINFREIEELSKASSKLHDTLNELVQRSQE